MNMWMDHKERQGIWAYANVLWVIGKTYDDAKFNEVLHGFVESN